MEGRIMKILLAEDDRVTRRLLESQLKKWGYSVLLAEDGEEALEVLGRPDGPRLALLDWMMPKLDGTQVCVHLRESGREDYVYVVLLTSRSKKEDVAAGLEAGADDYVVKPFDPTELKARLHVGERVIGFSQGLLSANAMLRTLAMTDDLTGLLTHGAILSRLHEEHARHSRTGLPLGLIMADIDHFKAVNDTFGHDVGDEVLAYVAGAIRRSCRPYDVVARYGGEEFLIILPATDMAHAASAAERIRTTVKKGAPGLRGPEHGVTVSLGVACLRFNRPMSPEELLRCADQAMYNAKKEGRDRVCQWAGPKP